MARVTARVLMILFSLVLSRNFSPSAMHLSMDRVRVTLLLGLLLTDLVIVFYYEYAYNTALFINNSYAF